jgi:hypothetical protein
MDQSGFICHKGETGVSATPAPLAGEALTPPAKPSGLLTGLASKGKGRAALVWSISGTLLSGVGFIALALFEQYNDSLNELNRDLKHFNETSADLVKRESLRRVITTVKDCFRELQASKAARMVMEHELRTNEEDRKELVRELQRLRERLAMVEGRQAATPIIVPAVHSELAPPAAKDKK